MRESKKMTRLGRDGRTTQLITRSIDHRSKLNLQGYALCFFFSVGVDWMDGRIIHSIDGENVAWCPWLFLFIFFAVSALLLQKRVICRPPENNFNQQLVHTQTTISNDLIQITLSHISRTESNNQRACSCRSGFDLRPMERVIECVVLSYLPTRGHFGFLATSGSLLVWCGAKCFIARAFSNRT